MFSFWFNYEVADHLSLLLGKWEDNYLIPLLTLSILIFPTIGAKPLDKTYYFSCDPAKLWRPEDIFENILLNSVL